MNGKSELLKSALIQYIDSIKGFCKIRKEDHMIKMQVLDYIENQYIEYQTPVVADEIQGTGSLGGLYTGLKRASNFFSFCVACDMPFLKPELITYLIENRLNSDVVIPKTRAGLEPLHAIYSKRCIKPIKTLLERGEFQIIKLLPEVHVHYCGEEEIKRIDPMLISFMNVNTKKDLYQIQKMLKGVPWTEKQEAC